MKQQHSSSVGRFSRVDCSKEAEGTVEVLKAAEDPAEGHAMPRCCFHRQK